MSRSSSRAKMLGGRSSGEVARALAIADRDRSVRHKPHKQINHKAMPLPCSRLRHKGLQRQLRGMTSIVVDGLLRYLQLGVLSGGVSGVWVAVVHREVAARDLQPNAVTGLEEVPGRPDVDRVLVDPPRMDQARVRLGVPI